MQLQKVMFFINTCWISFQKGRGGWEGEGRSSAGLSQSCSWKNQQNNTDFMPTKRIRLPFSMVCMMFNSPFWKKGHTRSRCVSQVGGRSVALCCFSHYWLVLYLFLVNSFILGIVLQRLFLPSLPFSSSPPLPNPSSSSSSSQLLYLQGWFVLLNWLSPASAVHNKSLT